MKQLTVAALGSLLLLSGVVLLVLPGPGLIVIVGGLAVLATQYTWAARPLEHARRRARRELDLVAHSRIRTLISTGGACGLTVAGILELIGVDLPIVTTLSAALLILSGGWVLGTVLYAHMPKRAAHP
jgi:uncharacterized protein (TIGR02611 family)